LDKPTYAHPGAPGRERRWRPVLPPAAPGSYRPLRRPAGAPPREPTTPVCRRRPRQGTAAGPPVRESRVPAGTDRWLRGPNPAWQCLRARVHSPSMRERAPSCTRVSKKKLPLILGEALVEPGAGEGPKAVGGPPADPKGLRRFLVTQSREVPKL